MKILMAIILIVGLAMLGLATLAYAHAVASSASMISDISTLRDTSGYERCEAVEIRTSQHLAKLRDETKPLMVLGALTAVLGLIGQVSTIRKPGKE